MSESSHNSDSTSRAWKGIHVTNIRSANGSGSVRAYCDVRLEFDLGTQTVFGFSVVQQDGKAPWVAFPQKPGKTPGKWFPVYEADGKLRKLIIAAVLDAFSRMPKKV